MPSFHQREKVNWWHFPKCQSYLKSFITSHLNEDTHSPSPDAIIITWNQVFIEIAYYINVTVRKDSGWVHQGDQVWALCVQTNQNYNFKWDFYILWRRWLSVMITIGGCPNSLWLHSHCQFMGLTTPFTYRCESRNATFSYQLRVLKTVAKPMFSYQ